MRTYVRELALLEELTEKATKHYASYCPARALAAHPAAAAADANEDEENRAGKCAAIFEIAIAMYE